MLLLITVLGLCATALFLAGFVRGLRNAILEYRLAKPEPAEVPDYNYAWIAAMSVVASAAIIALAKAFAEQGIKDGVQVNSIIPGAVMTGRRRSFLEKWAPAHGMSVEEATKKFPEEAGISRYGEPEEIAELLGFMVSSAAKWMTGTSVRMDGGEVKGI